ncbi:MAG: multicopper oxidase domain-containing protein, partial [Chloroflexaceae bacterium]|nr:multicopper oxidase domain-containing protein [Chloroflexaceae bacterium]
MSRRSFLRTGRTLLLASAVPWLSGCSIGSTGALSQIQQQTPHPSTAPDIEVALKATASQVSLLAGAPTRVWSYQGKVIQGSPSVMHHIPGSYLGPILRFQKGQTVRIHFTNDIPDESIIHWHGLHVPAAMDGHPQSVIKQGETFVYEFKILNRAGTYWFHPHPHGRTGPQVYNGLAGLFLVSDEEEAAVGLPTDAYDIPLVIQDRTFDDSNQFVYLPNGMMDQMHGFLGERILVNGQPDFILPVDATAYRIRLLNGSNSRIYRLAWNDGTPITVIGTDGGLLEKPIQRDSVVLAPAERIDVWRDFSTQPVGSEVQIRSLPFNGVETMDMMGGRGVMSGHGMMDERGMMQSIMHVHKAQRFLSALFVLTVRGRGRSNVA